MREKFVIDANIIPDVFHRNDGKHKEENISKTYIVKKKEQSLGEKILIFSIENREAIALTVGIASGIGFAIRCKKNREQKKLEKKFRMTMSDYIVAVSNHTVSPKQVIELKQVLEQVMSKRKCNQMEDYFRSIEFHALVSVVRGYTQEVIRGRTVLGDVLPEHPKKLLEELHKYLSLQEEELQSQNSIVSIVAKGI